MTQNEALRLALEALKESLYATTAKSQHLAFEAITAIKAALEAKDEPVACKECHLKDLVYDLLGELKVANLKLSVRPQRTWVGLTDEEFKDAINDKLTPECIAVAIEAKLKEKNNA